MLNQPGQQRASGFQSDSRLLFQEIVEGPRKSMHRVDSTLDLSIAFSLALGSDNTQLLIRLEHDSLVPHEVKVGHQSPCWTRVRHTPRRDKMRSRTMSTGSVSCDLSSRCPMKPFINRNCRDLFCLLCFRINSAMTKHMQSTNFEMGDGKRCAFPLHLRMAKPGLERASALRPPEPCLHQRIHQLAPDLIHQHW